MNQNTDMTKLKASELCMSCGLCCYAFHNLGLVKNEKEREVVESFSGTIFFNQSGKLSFVQPCPAFNGVCSVYSTYPSSCSTYQCKLLRSAQSNDIPFEQAKEIVQTTKKEVSIIDTELKDLLGARTVIVDDYIILFFIQVQDNESLKKLYSNLLLHFGSYKYLRMKYFDI